MNTIETQSPPREHPRKYDWIPVVPLAITLIVCVLSMDGLYKTWLEPTGLHVWMEGIFPRGFSGFDRYTDDPVRYKVVFSWIIVVASISSFLVSLVSIGWLYRYIVTAPRSYIIAVCVYLFLLCFFLFDIHGPSRPEWSPTRSIRSLFFTGLYSFGFWAVGLSLSAYYAWNGFFAYIIFVVRGLIRPGDA